MSATMIEATIVQQTQALFTCLSCSIAFPSAEDQRDHYRSDHHRYNMKRRVAGLPPVSAIVFNQKVIERREETAITASPKGMSCEVCKKSFTSENTYKSHLASKKHRENELKALHSPPAPKPEPMQAEAQPETEVSEHEETMEVEEPASASTSAAPAAVSLNVDEEAGEEEVERTIEEKIAAARSRLSPTSCLFCNTTSASLDDNLTHMSVVHSFFIPDAEYLVDIQGLITYLGEKIAVGNVCIYCNGRGREFRTLEAVRKHMIDKGHCKIGYDSEEDRLEISDFYDFTTSYPDAGKKKSKKKRVVQENEEWEDLGEDEDMDGEVDEVVEESGSEDDEDEDELPDNEIAYGDTPYELVLASGARIGHRSMRRYYSQSFPRASRGRADEDPNSGAAIVRRLLADKNSALVPMKGGFGAYGQGTQVVKARNAGEAKEAGRHVREYRDQQRREQFKTKVGFRHNSQKHFRDPLLQ